MESPADSEIKEFVHFREVLKDSLFTLSQLKGSLLSIYPHMESNTELFNMINILDTTRAVRSTAISYMTKDPKGNDIIASGLIIRPVNQKSKGVLHFFPSAKVDKFTVGSEMMLTFEGVIAFFGYTVVIPDLIGYGISDDTEYPFLFADNTGQVAYDLHLAAAEYFQSIGLPFSRKLTIGGYSMGGMGVVALHKHIETKAKDGFRVLHSYPGGGVYDLGKALDYYKEQKYCEFLFLPYMYISVDHWYDLKLDFNKVFIDPLLTHKEDWLSRNYKGEDLWKMLKADMTWYMHPDFFSSEGNEYVNKADSCIRLHSVLEGWHPRARMTIIHSVKDVVAPFFIAENMYQNFRKKGSPVTLITSEKPHFSYGIEYYASLLFYLGIK
ncbi:MAG: hypothetical protein WBK97_02180 [Bacteroidales bacterium]